jgi:phosphoglycolate phosphatase
MIRNLVIDLDGPILDGRQRHYWCYKEILESFGARALSIDEYWAQKRERVHASDILAASGAAARYEDFHRTWSAQIELPEALGRDRVQAGARETLSLWHNRRLRIVVATLRRNKRNLYDQLDALGLSSFFNDVVPCDYEPGDQGKAESVKALAGI